MNERLMRKISEEVDDWLRPEYTRSESGELVRGKYAATQVEFAELVMFNIKFNSCFCFEAIMLHFC